MQYRRTGAKIDDHEDGSRDGAGGARGALQTAAAARLRGGRRFRRRQLHDSVPHVSQDARRTASVRPGRRTEGVSGYTELKQTVLSSPFTDTLVVAELVSARAKIADYISGLPVNHTHEETDAVQPFSRKLVENYGYPKDHIRTRPQFRVRASPSDRRSYPVDIAVFSSKTHDDSTIRIIVECKAKTRKDGLSQLESYLKFCNAQLGVWYNGEEQLVLRKHVRRGGGHFSRNPRHTQLR